MTSWEYEFYLRVLKVSLTSEREDKIHIPKRPCNVLFILKILMKFLHKTQLVFFYSFSQQQNSAMKVVWSSATKHCPNTIVTKDTFLISLLYCIVILCSLNLLV